MSAKIRAWWKEWERKIAKYVGGVRVPITGRSRGDAPDIDHNWLAIEVKAKNKLPKYLFEARAQSEACAEINQLPVQIYAEKGMSVGDCFIVMRLSDFRDRWL